MQDVSVLRNRIFDDLAIGDVASIERTLTAQDAQLFAIQSGGFEPPNADPKSDVFPKWQGVLAHSMWAASLISGLLGTRLPGFGSTYRRQNFQFLQPIRIGDSLRVTVEILRLDPTDLGVVLDCQCVNQDGVVVIEGEAEITATREHIVVDRTALPEVRLLTSAKAGSKALIDYAKPLGPIRIAVVHPCDALSLSAALDAQKAGLVEPILVAPAARLQAIAAEAALDLTSLSIVDVPHSHAAAAQAAKMAAQGEVQALMKGSLHTDELMAAVLTSSAGLRTKRRVSHCFLMQTPFYPLLFIITDAAINIAPSLQDKADIIRNAIDLAHVIGVERPRVAILAAVETINPSMPATLEAAALCKMADRGQISGAVLDGPLALDNAVSLAAAQIKGIRSEVAGQADVLVVPDLESGNMLAKQIEYMGDAASAGIVMGAKVPIVLTSRADSREARISSCAIAVMLARYYENSPP